MAASAIVALPNFHCLVNGKKFTTVLKKKKGQSLWTNPCFYPLVELGGFEPPTS